MADTPIVIQMAMGFVADGRLEGADRAAPVAPLPQNVSSATFRAMVAMRNDAEALH